MFKRKSSIKKPRYEVFCPWFNSNIFLEQNFSLFFSNMDCFGQKNICDLSEMGFCVRIKLFPKKVLQKRPKHETISLFEARNGPRTIFSFIFPNLGDIAQGDGV